MAGWVVLGAHMLHLLLMWDFIFCYVRSIYRGEAMRKELDFSDVLAYVDV